MFENMTYQTIVQRMIDRVAEQDADIDTREGSVIFNALAPAAMEIAILYQALDNVLKQSFITTASRTYLFRACQQMGVDIEQFRATKGIHKARFNVPVTIGSRWSCDKYNFVIKEQITDDANETLYVYKAECETAGSKPNGLVGNLSPIDFSSNLLTYASLVGVLTYGKDEASNATIRSVYKEFVSDSLVDGNVAQYQYWANHFDGIGRAKVFPLWDGPNTVKVSILDDICDIADDDLIDAFQEYLDPYSQGLGDGVAPIGARVTVDTATGVTIDVSADVVLKDGYTDTSFLEETIAAYFRENVSYVRSSVSYLGVGTVLINTEGVDSVSNLLLNEGTADIQLDDDEVPVLGTATITLIT